MHEIDYTNGVKEDKDAGMYLVFLLPLLSGF
jgi:hypothetical protein